MRPRLSIGPKRATGLIAALALAGCIGLFAHAYHRAGAGPSGPGAAGPPTLGSSTAPLPQVSAPGDGTSGLARPAVVADAVSPSTVRLTLPAAPGFTIVPAARYELVLSATSAAPIGDVGYLVPTSPRNQYGTAHHVGTRWTLRTTVTGKPYYAAVFVHAGAAGVPVTCTISLGGKVISSATTHGSYGQQVCYG